MKPFIPETLPINNLNWEKLAFFIGRSNSKLSMYNGMLQTIPNPNILISPMTIQEAVLSSRIEGTQVSLTNVLEFESGKKEENVERKNDIQEVINYRKAIYKAKQLFTSRPFIHLNMLKDLHSILLNGVRGRNKDIGNFRTKQVHIGAPNSTIEEAYFIPPEGKDILPALNNWEQYINSDEQETLIQLAVLHAQFEIIHPFLDGNGRLGRILIPLYLYQKGLLSQPVFYLSEYFEKNREAYYINLRNITNNGDWQTWIEFFLNAIYVQANNNLSKAKDILNLYDNLKEKFIDATCSKYAIKILDAIFTKPIITIPELQDKTGIIGVTITSIMNRLVASNLISILQQGRGRSPTIYILKSLVNITEGVK